MSWEADQQLVRGSEAGKYNLAIGDPIFLREVMAPYYPRHYPADLTYPDTKPCEELMLELRKLHPEGEIVVTNGAKQGLLAAVAAYKNVYGVVSMWHKAPYWPSYPSIAETVGVKFNEVLHDLDSGEPLPLLDCYTAPNNPDGKHDSGTYCDVWDAAYASPVYGWPGQIPKHEVSVWSGGKLFGAPGIRIGWTVTQNQRLAAYMRRYVEQTTSGVSTTSQHHLAGTLRSTEMIRSQLFLDASNRLETNRSLLNVVLYDHARNISEQGMFAWVQALNPEHFAKALKDSGVLVVSGAACGDPTPGRYRISLGQNKDVHKEALTALRKELDK